MFTNRSRAIQTQSKKISKLDKSRLAIESAKLNIADEQLLSKKIQNGFSRMGIIRGDIV